MLKIRIPLISLLCLLLLSGCLERRSTGAMFDDQNIEYRLIAALYDAEGIDSTSHIKVEVWESVVLLMGETPTQQAKELAGRLAADVDRVDRVVNEIEVRPELGLGGKLGNSWLSTRVKTALIAGNPVPGFDATRIKVISSAGTVYLMGNLTEAEADEVTEIARNVGGVEKVVKVFNYIDADKG